MQYMSQATGWADSFTLAMAPLGILTIIVSAIRVGGPSWLKAIIGRARENLAAAEVELMSSTSVDVCELWNGSEIVRSLGSPLVREFILLIPKSRKDTASHTRHFDFECKNIKEAEEGGFLTPSNRSEDSERGMSMCSSESTNSVGIADSHEIELEDLNRSENVIIIYNESTSALSISLNVHPQKRSEVRAAAVIGTFLQLGVLIYAGFATYYHTLRFPKEEDKPVSNYAFPCTASGTIILVTGLLLCADVVEKRTFEDTRKPRAGYDAYAMWIQRQATVGDQVFKSFGIFSDEPRKEVATSSRDDISMVASKATDVSFVDRIVQVVCYLPFRIQKLFRPKSDSKAPLFTKY
ncbi:ankyrin repeat [Fusarium sp. NRRL 25303]|nr:ankyrin repeat [Fusarium sp. NRRL 25303]